MIPRSSKFFVFSLVSLFTFQLGLSSDNDSQLFQKRIAGLKTHINYLNKMGVTGKMKVNYSYHKSSGDNGNTADNFKDPNICEVSLSLNEKTGTLIGIGDQRIKSEIEKTIQYNEDEKTFLSEFILGHEVAHCGFFQMKRPFVFPGNEILTTAMNMNYADHLDKKVIGIKAKNEDMMNITIYGLSYVLNEAFADAYSSIIMLKKYGNNEGVVRFLKKLSAERAISSAFTRDITPDVIDAYDISLASKILISDDMLKIINKLNKNDDLKNLALEVAGKTVLDNLSRKSDKDLDFLLGVDSMFFQAPLLISSHDGFKKPGSLVTDAINKEINKLSHNEKNQYIKVISNFNGKGTNDFAVFEAEKEMEAFHHRIMNGFTINDEVVKNNLNILKETLKGIRQKNQKDNGFINVIKSEKDSINLNGQTLIGLETLFKNKRSQFPTGLKLSDFKEQINR